MSMNSPEAKRKVLTVIEEICKPGDTFTASDLLDKMHGRWRYYPTRIGELGNIIRQIPGVQKVGMKRGDRVQTLYRYDGGST